MLLRTEPPDDGPTYRESTIVGFNWTEASALLHRSRLGVEQDDSDCLALGCCHYEGKGVEQDVEKTSRGASHAIRVGTGRGRYPLPQRWHASTQLATLMAELAYLVGNAGRGARRAHFELTTTPDPTHARALARVQAIHS